MRQAHQMCVLDIFVVISHYNACKLSQKLRKRANCLHDITVFGTYTLLNILALKDSSFENYDNAYCNIV